ADAHNGPLLDELLAYIDAPARPGAPVPVYPLQPMLEFLAGREGAGGVHVIWPGQDPARHERIIADLEARDVRLVIYSFSHYASLGSFRENAPRLFEYLARHYAIERVFAHEPFGPLWCALGRRPQGPPPGTALPGSDGLVPALWSFTPVLAERVGTPDAPVVARLPLDVPPEQPRLDFAYGIDPERVASRPRRHRADPGLDRLARGEIAREEPRLAREGDRAGRVAPARLQDDAPARARREAGPGRGARVAHRHREPPVQAGDHGVGEAGAELAAEVGERRTRHAAERGAIGARVGLHE